MGKLRYVVRWKAAALSVQSPTHVTQVLDLRGDVTPEV
jgi:hypothetical protein